MRKSRLFYSKIPGLTLCYGGQGENFGSFEILNRSHRSYLNLELSARNYKHTSKNFVRIIFHTTDVDRLYTGLRKDRELSRLIVFENEPTNAAWGERSFQIRNPDGYQISFATPQ
jgi:hypothetical protein